MVGLKICGVTRAEDLRRCIELGVDAIGLNLWPGSRRHLSLDAAEAMLRAADVRTGSDESPTRVGVFVDAALAEVEAAVKRLGLALIQPHGDAPVEPYAALAAGLGVGWIWVIRGTPALSTLRVPSPAPSWILLDAAVPGYGGVGVRTDWAWAREAVQHLAAIPVWLAGGVTPENAAAAIAEVRPAGLDVASGSERAGATRGEKDPAKIAALVDICRAAGL